jgi:uncharacterized lipoprotein YmbA
MRPIPPILAVVALATTGCFGTSPPAKFYVLSSSAIGNSAVPSTGPEGTLGIMPTRVADYLDRPQIVTFLGDNSVSLDEYNRWAEPLGAGVTRVLSHELAALLPGWRVIPQPLDPVVPLRARLVVSISALGWNDRGEARLEATWAILSSGGDQALYRGRALLRREGAGPSTTSSVATTSALVGDLAHDVASAVRALPAGKP